MAVILLIAQMASADSREGLPASAPDLVINEVKSDGDTGAMHYVSRIQLSSPGYNTITISTDIEKGIYAPEIVRKIRVDAIRHLIVGVSSIGGGTQTWHALSVVFRDNRIALADQLAYTVDRLAPAMVLIPGDASRIGIIAPCALPLHPEEWRLRTSRISCALERLMALPAIQYHVRDADGAAILGANPGESRGVPYRVSWLRVNADGMIGEE